MRAKNLTVLLGLIGALLSSGYGVLFTMLDDFRDDYGISESSLGWIVGIGFVSGFLAQVTVAGYADRGHARRVVLAGLCLNLAALVIMATSTTLGPLLLGRFVMGVGIGVTQPALRRIVIVSDPRNLGSNLGRLLAFDVAGFAAGPAISAALVGPFGIPAPFLVTAAATLISIPLVARLQVPEASDAPEQRFAFDLLRLRPFAAAVAMGCCLWLMIGAFDTLWAVALNDLDTAKWIANLGISLFALPLIVVGPLGGRLAQRVGPYRVGSAGLLAAATFMFVYGHAPTGALMFAMAMVHGVTDGLSASSTGVAVGLSVPHARQAGAQGVLGGAQTLVAGIAAVAAGAMYDGAGRATAYGVTALVMLVLIASVAALAGRQFGLRDATVRTARDKPIATSTAD